ncbi:MAG: DinB family protein [Acidobacteriota bacterium]|nr:DinB family protein [Acidobacteriota bacterium]
MSENALPCLELLEATPAILRDLMSGLDDEDVRWKPAPDRFSIGEVLAHLSHTEGHCYAARLDLFLAGAGQRLEPYDPEDYKAVYAKTDPEDAFDHFEDQRATNLETLGNLSAADGARTAVHAKHGQVTLSEMLHEWALHDLGHIRQVAELVRARKYLPGAGPFASSYPLKP